MAWNNNSGGPWGGGGNNSGGGGGGGPWGSGGGGNRGGGGGPFGSRRPPDMEDVIRKGQERLRNLMPGGLGSFKGLLLIALAAVVIWLLTGFFRVQPNQQAIQLIFGKPYGGPVASGLHYNLPAPIGNVVVVNVQDQRRTVIGSRGATDRTPYGRGQRPTSSENLMLTGDENIVDIEFAVLWQIKDVFKYAFNVRNGEENVRQAAEAAMREVIGKSNLQYAQTEGRTRIEQDTKDLLQRILDDYGLGVQIAQVQLLRVDPPQEVIGAFRDVQAARADKEKNINEANTYRNQVLPRAKGEAETIIQRGRRLQGAEGRQRQGRYPALHSGLRPVRQGKGHHLGAPLHRGDRRGAAQREQGADRQERRRGRALSAPARTALRSGALAADEAGGASGASAAGATR